MSEPAVVFDGVGVRAHGRPILSDVTFPVDTGQLVGVLGPNGAGKTTLISLINALRRPTCGRVTVLGTEPSTLRGHGVTRLRRRIGYVPQLTTHDTHAPISVRDVVAIARAGSAGLLRALGANDHAVIDHWMARLGITDLADRSYRSLSGGEKRKVHLARALAQEPELLLLDEPASHLDMHWQEQFCAIIHALWAETHLTVIMVTHDVHQLPAGCSRLALLARGRLEAWGTPAEVLCGERLEHAFGHPVEVVRRNGRYHVLPLAEAVNTNPLPACRTPV